VGKLKRKKPMKEEKAPIRGKGVITYSLPQGENGPLQLHLDMAQARIPDIFFYSNIVFLQADYNLASVRISFGRVVEKPAKSMRRVDIVMPESAISRYITSIKNIEGTVNKALERIKGSPIKEVAQPETDQVVTLYANHIYASVSGEESCMDFYYISPRDLHIARTQKGNIALDPVIRVPLSTVLFKHLNELLYQQEKLKENPPKVESGVEHADTR